LEQENNNSETKINTTREELIPKKNDGEPLVEENPMKSVVEDFLKKNDEEIREVSPKKEGKRREKSQKYDSPSSPRYKKKLRCSTTTTTEWLPEKEDNPVKKKHGDSLEETSQKKPKKKKNG